LPNCPECANREILKKRTQLEAESEAAYEEGKDFRMPTYREIEEEIDFPMKLDTSTKHFICKRCGLYATKMFSRCVKFHRKINFFFYFSIRWHSKIFAFFICCF
jgi:hypothetical protein